MKPLLIPARVARAVRATEATPEQVIVTGASLGSWGAVDPVDGDTGWRPAGLQGRQMPPWTLEKARIYSVASYRSNPMARAVIDTYTSFCVGDSGVKANVTNPDVKAVVDEFWTDPRNQIADLQELWLRDQFLMGESLIEMMVGPMSGTTRFSPIDPSIIEAISYRSGNPLWIDEVIYRNATTQDDQKLTVVDVDDATGLRDGQAMLWQPFKTLITDQRSIPFMSPILDWLDSYDGVLGNLIDRTALARYLVWDVTVQGDQNDVDTFIKNRGGTHVPRSGSVEVHNQAVKWEPKTATTGAMEDSVAASSVLTLVAGGSGLSKTWLAEPDGANRATSLTMAEPVRRRVAGVQKTWLGYQTELVRFAVDQAVKARRLPATVEATDPQTGATRQVKAAQAVTVTGPEIAAADAQITAEVIWNLGRGLEKLVSVGALTKEGAAMAARKAWEDYVGIPFQADLAKPDAHPDDIATHIDDTGGKQPGGLLHVLPSPTGT